MKNDIITYIDGSLELNVPVSWEEETVWLTRAQMADLFDRDVKTIGKYINNALRKSWIIQLSQNLRQFRLKGEEP